MGIAEEVFTKYALRGEFAVQGVRDCLVAGRYGRVFVSLPVLRQVQNLCRCELNLG